MKLIKWISVTDRYNKIHLDRMFAPFGLNSSQHMYVLRICEVPGITQDQFNSLFYINPSNITRSVAALEKMGYLEPVPHREGTGGLSAHPGNLRGLEPTHHRWAHRGGARPVYASAGKGG